MLTKNIKKHDSLLILYHKTLLSSCFFPHKNMKKHKKNMDFRLKKYYIIFLYSKYEKIQLLIVRLSYKLEG